MATRSSSGLLLISVVIILLVLECSSAKCYQGCTGGERKDQSEDEFVWGRKLLQGPKGKSIDIQERSKSADVDISFPVPQMEGDHIQAQENEGLEDEFMEAADEVATLMRKDYKGADRPRRKPPINNTEPKN